MKVGTVVKYLPKRIDENFKHLIGYYGFIVDVGNDHDDYRAGALNSDEIAVAMYTGQIIDANISEFQVVNKEMEKL